jgi:3',5'-cyclic AMP phosphodiesterase CpdA
VVNQKRGKEVRLILLLFVCICFCFSILVLLINWQNNYAKNNQNRKTVIELVGDRSEWQYMDAGMEPGVGDAWTLPGYDAAHWKQSSGPFSVAENGSGKLILNGSGNSGSIYFRHTFTIKDLSDVHAIIGSISYRYGVLVYLNGKIVYAGNVPENGYDNNMQFGAAQADGQIRRDKLQITDVSALKKGDNVLAVEIHRAGQEYNSPLFEMKAETSFQKLITDSPDVKHIMLQNGGDEHETGINLMTSENDEGYYEVHYVEKKAFNMKKNHPREGEERIALLGRYNGEKESVHRGKMTELKTGTEYLYCVSRVGDTVHTKWLTFVTPSRNSFSVLLLGDPQLGSYGADDRSIWNAAIKKESKLLGKTDYIFSLGDQVDATGEKNTTLKAYYDFRYPDLFRNTPAVMVMGNHESGTNAEEIYRCQFGDQPYSFVCQNTLVVVLNSNDSEYENQIQYMEKTIRQNNHKWVIVLMHHSLFSSGEHSDDEKTETMRKAYSTFFSRMDVDLVISGHDHIYSRSYLMNGEQPLNSSISNRIFRHKNQTMYLTAGSSSGNKFYTDDVVKQRYTEYLFSNDVATTARLTVSGNLIDVEAYRMDTEMQIDHFVLEKQQDDSSYRN